MTRTSYLLSRGGEKLPLSTVKGCCVGKPVSQLHWTLRRDSCSLHMARAWPHSWGNNQRKCLWRRILSPQTDSTVDADHKQQVKYYRHGNLQSSICCISSEKWTWRFPLLPGCSQQPSYNFQKLKGFSQGISSNERVTFTLITSLPVTSFTMFSVFLQITLSPVCTITDRSCKAHSRPVCDTAHSTSSSTLSAKSCLG